MNDIQAVNSAISVAIESFEKVPDSFKEFINERVMETLSNPLLSKSVNSGMKQFHGRLTPPSVAAYRVYNIFLEEVSEEKATNLVTELFKSLGREEELSMIAL